MKPINARVARLENALRRPTQPDPASITWVKAKLRSEDVDPDVALQPDGTLIIGGPKKQYIGCLKVLFDLASGQAPDASWRTAGLSVQVAPAKPVARDPR